METLSRRSFIQAAAGAAALGLASPGVGAQRDAGFRGPLCFFSKHLPRMNGRELGRSLKALGFDAVEPERLQRPTELPSAAAPGAQPRSDQRRAGESGGARWAPELPKERMRRSQ